MALWPLRAGPAPAVGAALLTALGVRSAATMSFSLPSLASTQPRWAADHLVARGGLRSAAHAEALGYRHLGGGACLAAGAATAVVVAVATRSTGSRRWSRCRQTLAAVAADGKPFRVLVPVADDSEEIETACITDVLVRAGAAVTVASVSPSLQVRMSRGLKVTADVSISDCVGQQWDVIACPGGMPGAERLRDSKELTELLKEHHGSGRLTAAVCASPAVVFATHGLIGKSATSYPAPQFKELVGAGWTEAQAVVDGNVITSQGPGTSLQFALKIVEVLYGRPKAEELAKQMVTHAA